MTAEVQTNVSSYDDVPYTSHPMYSCHPDCLAALGELLGMTPARPSRCRMLEIGCASGGNLVPLALQFPASQFVGLDLSAVQIDAGKEMVRDLGIANLDLRAQSVMEIDETWGKFDYIICHGVFSWVPEPVRAKILTICRDNLAPQGIAYISYNTYPGWYVRKTLRDVLNLHVRRFADPGMRISQAREFLEFLDKHGLAPDTPFATAMRGLIAELRDHADYYLYHEYLEEENTPFYFSDFMAMASAHGLQYLGNAVHHTCLDNLKPEAKATLLNLSEDLVQLEQFYDFLANRPFRRSLLCHSRVSLDRTPSPAVIARMHVVAVASPVSDHPDCFSTASEAFEVDGKNRCHIEQPLAKTMLVVLAEAWPNSIPAETLWATVRQRLAEKECLPPQLASAEGFAIFAQYILQTFLSNMLRLQVEPFSFATTPGPRPRASRLARWQVAHDLPDVSSLRHNVAKLERIDRILMPLLDGVRTIEQVQDALVQRVADGKLSITDDSGQPLTGANLRAAVAQTVEKSLANLLRKGLIEA